MGVGYEVIRVTGMISLGQRVCYMRITCTKHAVYQGVKQGCDNGLGILVHPQVRFHDLLLLSTVPHVIEVLAVVDGDVECCWHNGGIVWSIGDCQKRYRGMEPEPPAPLSSAPSQILPECIQAGLGVSRPQQRP